MIWAIFKLDRKTPCTKERFARWAMSGEKVEEHNLINEVVVVVVVVVENIYKAPLVKKTSEVL